MDNIFLVLATWPDGTTGLLFPRPGYVPIMHTLIDGNDDFMTAKRHLLEYVAIPGAKDLRGTKLRLVEFKHVEDHGEFTYPET